MDRNVDTRAVMGRHSIVDSALVVLCAVTVVLVSGWWLVPPTLCLVAVSLQLRARGEQGTATWIAAVGWAAVAVFTTVSFGLVWPIPQLLGLGASAVVLRAAGWERPRWLEPGRSDRPAAVLAATSIPVTSVALVLFIASGRTNLETATEGLAPLPIWALPLAGLGFVFANPTVEETLFRGLLQTMVGDATGRPAVGIVVQGGAFGAVHYAGVPGGPLGMAMATAWGVMLGVIRHRTSSIHLPWIVHVLANVAIFATVVTLALRDNVL